MHYRHLHKEHVAPRPEGGLDVVEPSNDDEDRRAALDELAEREVRTMRLSRFIKYIHQEYQRDILGSINQRGQQLG